MMVTACDTTINSSAMKTGNFNHGYSRQQLQKRTSQPIMAYADMNLHNHLSLLFPTSIDWSIDPELQGQMALHMKGCSAKTAVADAVADDATIGSKYDNERQ